MGMPITIEIVGENITKKHIDDVFSYFRNIDNVFSTYKKDSQISKLNRNEISLDNAHNDVRAIYKMADDTRTETNGYFNHKTPDGTIDPSGIVKGWSIQKASENLKSVGVDNFCIDVGGDIQTNGVNIDGEYWSVGIRHPFEPNKIAKVVYPKGRGVATSGTYIRGAHIYNPKTRKPVNTPFVSLTVIGPNIYDADRFATAAFAMGENGINFIEKLKNHEAYAITNTKEVIYTNGFNTYTQK